MIVFENHHNAFMESITLLETILAQMPDINKWQRNFFIHLI